MLDCLDAHERRYAQGERIHHMGDSVSTAGIVLTGRVRIEHVDPWGNAVSYTHLGRPPETTTSTRTGTTSTPRTVAPMTAH